MIAESSAINDGILIGVPVAEFLFTGYYLFSAVFSIVKVSLLLQPW